MQADPIRFKDFKRDENSFVLKGPFPLSLTFTTLLFLISGDCYGSSSSSII